MPADFLTDEEKKQRLVEMGLDPSQYDLVDSSSNNTVPVVTQPKSAGTSTEAALTGARRNIGGTIGGIGSAALLSWLAGPEVGLPATLLAGLTGGFAGSSAQSEIEPKLRGETDEETTARLQHEAQLAAEHPIANKVGELAPNLIAFRPSPKTLAQAFTGSRRAIATLGTGTLSAAQKAAIANVGVNAAIGGGIEGAQELYNEHTIHPLDVLKEAAIQGTLFNEPWLLGPKLGFHPSVDTGNTTAIYTSDQKFTFPQQGYTSEIGPIMPNSARINQAISGDINLQPPLTKASDTMLAQREINDKFAEQRKRQDDFVKAKLELEQQSPKSANTDAEPPTSNSNVKPLTQNQLNITQDSLTKSIASNVKPEIRQGEGNINDWDMVHGNEGDVTDIEQLEQDLDKKYGNSKRNFQEAGENLDADKVNQIEKNLLPQLEEGPYKEAWKKAIADYRANPEKGLIPPVINNEGNTTVTSKGNSKKKPYIKNPEGKEQNPFLGLASEPLTTKSYVIPKAVLNHLAKEGFKVGDNLILNPSLRTDTGKVAAGMSTDNPRQIEINPLAARNDTEVHETIHNYINEALQNPKTKKMMTDFLEKFGAKPTDEYHPENLVQPAGEKASANILNSKQPKFVETFISALKHKLGIASQKDVINLLAEHIQNNAPYVERQLMSNGGAIGAQKNFQKVNITADDSKEILHKLQILADEPDLQNDYNITSEQAKELVNSVPKNGGDWNIPEWGKHVVNGEMQDHVTVLRHIAEDARGENKVGQALKIERQANKFERLFSDSLEKRNLQESNNESSSTLTGRNFQPAVEHPDTFENNSRLISSDEDVNNVKTGINREELYKDTSLPKRLLRYLNPFEYTKGELQRIREVPAKEYPIVANALEKVAQQAHDLEGKYRNIVDAWQGLNAQERDLLHRTMIVENRRGESLRDTLPSEKLKAAYDKYREALVLKQQDQINAGELVKDYRLDKSGKKWEPYMRPAKINPYYYPNTVAGDIFEILGKPEHEATYDKVKQDFIDYQKEHHEHLTDKQAEELFREFIENVGASRGSNTTGNKFGANRYAEGIGLPDSWIEPDPLLSNRRYLRRVANDRAFFDNVENQPEIARMVGINTNQLSKLNPTRYADGTTIKDISINPSVRNVLDIIQGKQYSKSPKLDAAVSVANSLLLGPVSGLTDLATVPINIAKYVNATDLPQVMLKGLKNLKQGYEHSLETGFNKKDPTLIHDMFGPITKAADRLYTLRNVIYTTQGRRHLEILSRALSQSMGEAAIEISINNAINGDKNAIKLLSDITKQPNITPEQLDVLKEHVPQLATRIGELVQGTYDYRNLPMWALNSSVSPIFRLARWNIEQTNHFNNHILVPARNGNLQPLIISTLGAVLGGALIKTLRETTNDKKSYLPTLTEMAKSSKGLEGNKENVAYSLLAMASYAGYAGILSDMARSSMDVLHKNNPQSFNFPAFGMVSDATTRLLQGLEAIKNNDSTFTQVAPRLVGDLLKNNIQLARLANTWLLQNTGLDKEGARQKDTSSKLRDLRVFKQVEGMPYSSISAMQNNPYENLAEKTFKRETDLPTAMSEARDIIQSDREKYKNNPAQLENALTSLRRNSYQTMPNPNRDLQTFMKYVNYVKATQGEEAAQKLIADYQRQNTVNRIKSGFIPKF